MKKIWGWIVGVALVILLAIYVTWNGSGSGSNNVTAGTPNPSDNTTGTSGNQGTGITTTASGTGSGVGSGSASGSATSSAYQDGTYTGPVADAIYGKLQLVVTISGGVITNIIWPVYPNSAGHTSEVSASALPQLEQEAITSQSANVTIVSGATQTSEAFQQSLAAALSQAKG